MLSILYNSEDTHQLLLQEIWLGYSLLLSERRSWLASDFYTFD